MYPARQTASVEYLSAKASVTLSRTKKGAGFLAFGWETSRTPNAKHSVQGGNVAVKVGTFFALGS